MLELIDETQGEDITLRNEAKRLKREYFSHEETSVKGEASDPQAGNKSRELLQRAQQCLEFVRCESVVGDKMPDKVFNRILGVLCAIAASENKFEVPQGVNEAAAEALCIFSGHLDNQKVGLDYIEG